MSWFGSEKTSETITEQEVRDLFQLWNSALLTEDPDEVAKRYAKEGVLLPTVSDLPRTNYDLIRDYFVHFLQLKPSGVILESYVTIGQDWCSDVGIYEFTMGSDGSKVVGRYTFVYVLEDDEWKISHHHSSKMPEGTTGDSSTMVTMASSIPEIAPEAITEQEVKDLFQLWNSALLTEDPDEVAKRYAKEGVLLPTVSDVPRTNYDLIRDYFVHFLKLKPSGVILESYVTMGHNWCSDVGIYEFGMGADGSKVKGRYTFVYVWEDGEWKISHHHSSKMPEGSAEPPKKNAGEVPVTSKSSVWCCL